MNVPLEPFLYLAAALFALGVYGLITRREPVSFLLSLQIVTHAILIALVTFDRGSMVPVGPRLASGREADFGDAFAASVLVLLCVQTIVGLTLILRQGSAHEATPEPRGSGEPSALRATLNETRSDAAPGSPRLKEPVMDGVTMEP